MVTYSPEYFFITRALIAEWIQSLIFFLKLESIPQILRYCIYETMYLVKDAKPMFKVDGNAHYAIGVTPMA